MSTDTHRVTTYDRHGSHTTLDWITLASANNIILYCLHPYTTHRLQPLDDGFFGPLQIAWFNWCDEILNDTGEPKEMKEVVWEYFVARMKAFKSKNIFQACKKSGLHPLNANLFTASDFTPSYSSSTTCHVPQSFPSRMSHVPDASSDDGIFDPEQFQHLVDDSHTNPMEVSSESDSNSEFGLDQSGLDLSMSEDGLDNLEVNGWHNMPCNHSASAQYGNTISTRKRRSQEKKHPAVFTFTLVHGCHQWPRAWGWTTRTQQTLMSLVKLQLQISTFYLFYHWAHMQALDNSHYIFFYFFYFLFHLGYRHIADLGSLTLFLIYEC